MLIIEMKNNTAVSYDNLRKRVKAAFVGGNAYRYRDVMFDDQKKKEGILTLTIGDAKNVDLRLQTELNSVDEIAKVVSVYKEPVEEVESDSVAEKASE